MANKVQPEEILAAQVLRRVLGVTVTHTDVNGETDLFFETPMGTSGAVEVTFLTDQQTKIAQDAWVRERRREHVVTQLASSWNVTVKGDSVRYKLLRQHLEPHLAALEAAGTTEYDQYGIAHRLLKSIPQTVLGLAALQVVQAHVIPTNDPSVQHIFLIPMAGYTARGSEAALAHIEEYLADRTDNVRKLEESGATERHLFVWLDRDTPGEISRPFTDRRIVERFAHFGLPHRSPILPEGVTHLWVLHSGTGIGWRWHQPAGWQPLDLREQLAGFSIEGNS